MDLIEFDEITQDLLFINTSTKKAENLLTTQINYLHYAYNFGVDREYFLNEDFKFQNEAFKNYLLQRMAENLIDVTGVITTFERFYQQFAFSLAEVKQSDTLMG